MHHKVVLVAGGNLKINSHAEYGFLTANNIVQTQMSCFILQLLICVFTICWFPFNGKPGINVLMTTLSALGILTGLI